MSYKTILVSLNEVGRVAELVAAAVTLGRDTGAHVSGLYVVPAVQVYPSVGFEAAPQVFEGNRTFFKDNAQRVKQLFEDAMRREGVPHDFHQIDARTPVIADEVIVAGRSADLVVLSATNPDEITGVERDFVEQVVMAAGRPVVVLPYHGDAAISLKEIVIGWDGGREAARATFDALPLLKKATKVRVVRIDPQKDASLRGSVAGADLAESLARHGVKAEVDWRSGYAVLVNEAKATEFARGVARELVGVQRVNEQAPALTGSEDFAFMLQKVPGSYLLIGNGDGEGSCMVHNPAYDFNDDNIATGSAYWVLLTRRFLAS